MSMSVPSTFNAMLAERTREKETVFGFCGGIVGVHTRCGGRDEPDDSTRALPSGNTAKVQTLALPAGTTSVIDVSWSHNQDMIAMLRQCSMDGDGVSNSFYDIVEEEVDDPLEGPSFYSNEVALPPNIELSNFDLSHWGTTLAFCVKEELDRYISFTTDDETSNVHGEPEHDIDIDAASSPSSTELITLVNRCRCRRRRCRKLSP